MKMRRLLVSGAVGALLVLTAVLVVACGGASDGEVLRSDKARIVPAGNGSEVEGAVVKDGDGTVQSVENTDAVSDEPDALTVRVAEILGTDPRATSDAMTRVDSTGPAAVDGVVVDGRAGEPDADSMSVEAEGLSYLEYGSRLGVILGVDGERAARAVAQAYEELYGVQRELDDSGSGADQNGGEESRFPKARDLSADGGSDVDALARDNREFAFDLYHALRTADGNLFYSPHSISLALAMTYAGARGDTATQMGDALRFPLPQERLHLAFNAIDLALASRGEDDEGFRLHVLNAVWGQRGHGFRDEFLDVLAQSYGAGVRTADFATAPDAARVAINDWVAENTENRIKDLIPPDVINPLTRMVLTNAVYFKAAWAQPFIATATRDHPFELLSGGSVDVPMMMTEADLGYAAGDGYVAVDLPYEGNEMSMTVLVSDRGRFAEFEESLDAALVERIVADLVVRPVELDLPRFEFQSRFRMAETFRSMGMTDAFDSGASDFSGMDGLSCAAGDDGCLYIGDVVHQAFVSVDEEGTEAAAATAVMMQTESAKPRPVSVTVDRPFIFLIRDRATGTALFVGRVTEP